MTNFNYSKRISFQTVYYDNRFAYCCCGCGFQHEFIDYLSETGDLDEEIYERVVQSIENGYCPHVSQVPKEYVTETSVLGFHLAAAAGTEDVVKQLLDTDHRHTESGIFKVTPHMMAVMKNNHSILEVILQKAKGPWILPAYDLGYVIVNKSEENPNIINFENVSFLEFCIRNEDKQSLNILFKHYFNLLWRRDHILGHSLDFTSFVDMSGAFELVLKNNLLDILPLLLEFESKIPSEIEITDGRNTLKFEYKNVRFLYMQQAIFHNKPEILDLLLERYTGPQIQFKEAGCVTTQCEQESSVTQINAQRRKLVDICGALERSECMDILSKHGFRCGNQKITATSQITAMLQIMKHSKYSLDELLECFKGMPKLHQDLNNTWFDDDVFVLKRCLSPLQYYIYASYDNVNPKVVRMLIDLGADIDWVDHTGNTSLTNLIGINGHTGKTNIRETLEELLYENPCTQSHKTAVSEGLLMDLWDTSEDEVGPQERYSRMELIMDAKQRSDYGHLGDSCWVFNYFAPLLMECGFPADRTELEDYINLGESLHLSEKLYIHNYLSEPRSLKLKCRDTLRKHFKGRCIHEFVKVRDVPKPLTDFILLKQLLACRKR